MPSSSERCSEAWERPWASQMRPLVCVQRGVLGGEAVLLSMGAVGMELCPTQGCAALNFC